MDTAATVCVLLFTGLLVIVWAIVIGGVLVTEPEFVIWDAVVAAGVLTMVEGGMVGRVTCIDRADVNPSNSSLLVTPSCCTTLHFCFGGVEVSC